METIKFISDLRNEIKILEIALITTDNVSKKERIKEIIKKKEDTMNLYKNVLGQMSENQIEYRIYFKILNGMTPTAAVEEVANENYMLNISPNSVNRIWTKYYKNLKNIINKSETKVK